MLLSLLAVINLHVRQVISASVIIIVAKEHSWYSAHARNVHKRDPDIHHGVYMIRSMNGLHGLDKGSEADSIAEIGFRAC